MKKLPAIVLCLLFAISAAAQMQTITEADIKFSLPNDKWHLHSNNTDNYPHVYTYKRAAIIDKSNREVIPNISLIIENVPDTTDIVVYSGYKRERLKFTVEDAFSALSNPGLLKHKYALGFRGNYTDSKNLPHTIYYVIYIHKGKAVQLVCDVTTELFAACKGDFDAVIRSVANISPYENDGTLTQETIRVK